MIKDLELPGNIFSDTDQLNENDKEVSSFDVTDNNVKDPVVASEGAIPSDISKQEEPGSSIQSNASSPINSVKSAPSSNSLNPSFSDNTVIDEQPPQSNINTTSVLDGNQIPFSKPNLQEQNVFNNKELISGDEQFINNNKETQNNNVENNFSNINSNVLPEEELLQNIKDVDERIKQLTEEVSTIKKSEKDRFYEMVDRDVDPETNGDVQVVNSNTNNNYKQSVLNTINNLNRQKTKLLNELNKVTNSSSQSNNLNVKNSSEQVNSFTPNFINKDITSELIENNNLENNNYSNTSVENAVATEKILGGEPKIVKDPVLGDVVIDKKQGSLENAIEEHGGIDNAIKDSINNQSTVNKILNKQDNNSTKSEKNYVDGDKITHVFNATEQFLGEETNNTTTSEVVPNNESVNPNIPDASTTLNVNTGEILTLLNKIIGELSKINSSIQKTNKTTSSAPGDKSGTSTGSEQLNNSSGGSTSQSPMPAPKQPDSSNLSSKLKDMYPLEADFPPGMDLTKIGGRNL